MSSAMLLGHSKSVSSPGAQQLSLNGCVFMVTLYGNGVPSRLVGDFMLASNIDSYCVDSIKDFWKEKRAKLITHLHPKGPVVILGKGNYKDSGIHHSLDIWHGTKNVGKKVLTAGQQKGCSILQMWNKDICRPS
ncbi:hypothetical protein KUCAC02_028056 [Chaenocephalus aceratus]|uniref:Uncharacterized protein n=1 Tax=Chaenocephalus aceratus TaxID=36190 RepID=A0ACB9X1C3_CHAAC|nr:hypothetical protein KUCAC02_028056 [Chaenocephalus aceratus]